jgi:hypothetical protein
MNLDKPLPLSSPRPRRRRRRARRAGGALALAIGVLGAVAACDENGGTPPHSLRFGQVGSVRLVMVTPLALGAGSLRQEVVWSSDGAWTLQETVSYDGETGDSDVRRVPGNLEVSAGIYAEWIRQVNETPGLRLFVEELDPFLDPVCTNLQSRLSLTIRDDVRATEASWTRCAPGPLRVLTPAGSGPEPAASRVANAGLLLRDYTVGVAFGSAYAGTVPFATIDRGEDSGSALSAPLVITDPSDWTAFWSSHARTQGPAPTVDFERDMVVVGSVGERQEAGDSVRVRQILPVGGATVVVLQERVPGDFCSPAEKRHVPFHIVRLPIVPLPVTYADIEVVRVPCG